jgi:ABC-type transport system involved in multi-copper enzyme maturation permease subunit
MTAIVSSQRSSTPAGSNRLVGLRPLARKDLAEWRAGSRAIVVLAVTTVVLALTAANGWINAFIIANLPPGMEAPDAPVSMAPLDNIAAAVGTQFAIIATIFATMSLLVGERERGTLEWVASKPIGRGAIWTAKWLAASLALGLVAGIVPLVAVTVLASVLYGAPAVGPVVVFGLGIAAAVTLYVAVTLAAATIVWNQAAVAAIGFAVLVVPVILGGLVPVDIEPYLPTSILGWAMAFGMGADVGFVTPVAWALGVAGLVAFGVWRMARIEL